jgi:hypothetical protein
MEMSLLAYSNRCHIIKKKSKPVYVVCIFQLLFTIFKIIMLCQNFSKYGNVIIRNIFYCILIEIIQNRKIIKSA